MIQFSTNINRSGKAGGGGSSPSAPEVLPQDPNAEEYAGIAYLVKPSGELVDPSVVRAELAQSTIWVLACSVTPGEATLCRVEAVYQLTSISDAFQLKSKRPGASVQVVLLSKPGQARSQYSLLNSNTATVINVHFEDYQVILNSSYVFRPAFDRVGDGGAITSSWQTDLPETTAGAYMDGQLLWTDKDATMRTLKVIRSPIISSIQPIQQGDMLKRVVLCQGGAFFSSVVYFELPCGFKFTEAAQPSQEPDPEQYKKLLWMCWYKVAEPGVSGNLLTCGIETTTGLTDLATFNPDIRVDKASLVCTLGFQDV